MLKPSSRSEYRLYSRPHLAVTQSGTENVVEIGRAGRCRLLALRLVLISGLHKLRRRTRKTTFSGDWVTEMVGIRLEHCGEIKIVEPTVGTRCREGRRQCHGRMGRITLPEHHMRGSPLKPSMSIFTQTQVFSYGLEDISRYTIPDLSVPLQPHSNNRCSDYYGTPPISEQRGGTLR
jgi:hypothetical protein